MIITMVIHVKINDLIPKEMGVPLTDLFSDIVRKLRMFSESKQPKHFSQVLITLL